MYICCSEYHKGMSNEEVLCDIHNKIIEIKEFVNLFEHREKCLIQNLIDEIETLKKKYVMAMDQIKDLRELRCRG